MDLRFFAPAFLIAAIASGAAMAAEEKPALLGSFRDWHVYQTGKGANRLCYALSQPKDTSPKDAKRDSPFFLISTWPGRKVRNEPSVVPGYQYKDGAKTDVQVGSDKFSFFTKNDGSAGGAWMEDAKDEKRLIDSMKKGADMSVTGISSRGTMTHDNYSLAGISAALDKLDSSCK
ncbi:MAG TPA: invasion associated locus B family protein [Micropepsaceae bacterium]|nr:invasion associated locus B family protein [Micropepsaceae bacterium]